MKKLFSRFWVVMLMMALAPLATLHAQVWKSDPNHSTVMYSIRHVLTPMIGVFKNFEVEMKFDPAKPLESTVNATLDASSVMMGPDKLGDHLRTADFFDVEKYPQWTFKSTSIVVDKKAKSKTKTKYIAHGDLTVHGVTKQVAIPFEFLGAKETQWANIAGFAAEFTINRLDYGIGKGEPDDSGFVGNNVKITVLLEMNAVK
jgi:polyisoprenoid-binding protein YceI